MFVINEKSDTVIKSPTVVTVGTFDGIHLGHKKIFKHMKNIAGESNLKTCIVTFDPHPRLVLQKKKLKNIKLITTTKEKIDLFKKEGINYLKILKFNEKIRQYPYQLFLTNILIRQLNMKHLVFGYDHAFGKDRMGNFENISKLTTNYDFEISQVAPFEVDQSVIGSSKIRNWVSEGDFEKAEKFLGRRYSLTGTIISGDGRGKKINYPTANIAVENEHKLIPDNGVYAVDIKLHNKLYKGMMNIGNRPTFREAGYSLEVHLFNFSKKIYGEKIEILFKKKIRDERQFQSAKELKNQLDIDKEISLKI